MAAAEQKKSYQVVKQFKGLDTQANRTAIADDEFSWLENAQPIGYANLKITPAQDQVYTAGNAAVAFSSAPTYLTSVNIGDSDYVVGFLADGSAQYYNVTTNIFGNVAVAGTFTNTGMSTTQYNNDRMMILDQKKGLYSWDSNNVVSIGSVGTIGLIAGGTGYTSAPTVVISGPDDPNGVQANAVATINTANVVNSVTITGGGSGYTNAANLSVTFTGGGGSGANARGQILSFAVGILNIAVISGGSGYTPNTAIPITISGGGGSGATAIGIVGGNAITQVIMTNTGSNYTNVANITVSATGGNVAAKFQPVVNNNNNVGIATFSGRVWVAYGRSIAYSAAGYYSDFTAVSAGSVNLTDSTLHGNIQYLLSANNFLYIFGDDSINVFSDVRVTTSGATIFTNTNVSASVGSKRSNAIFPYFRSVLFLNDYGVYALVGSTTSKISDPLDGMFPGIDFSNPVYAGQVLLNNILCAAFNFRYFDSIFTNSYRYIQAVFFEKKWFLTSQGDSLAYITSVPVAGKIALYGTSGNNLYKLYGNATTAITSRVQTALLPMTDPIRTKQALKFAIEATNSNAVTLSATVDSEVGSSPTYSLSSVINWTNNSLAVIPWINNSLQVVTWDTVGYELYKSDAAQYGKYLGLTVTSNSAGFVYNGFEFEHELRVRF